MKLEVLVNIYNLYNQWLNTVIKSFGIYFIYHVFMCVYSFRENLGSIC